MVKQLQSNSDIVIFDRNLIKTRRERAAKNFTEHGFLFEWSKNQISERLYDINRNFDKALQIGARGAFLPSQHEKLNNIITMDITSYPIEKCDNYIQSSEEFLPISRKSMDLIISNLNLHSVNDLTGALVQIRNALKDDGLFIASIFGGETLHELRKIMMEVEIELYNGASPHIFPFADKIQIGELLKRANFNLPVIDSDIITATYDNVFKLLHDLRGMGESNSIIERKKEPFSKEFFMRIAQEYHNQFAESDGRIVASFEVIFMLGWSPHKSQQKPLQPGSAEFSLAEALKTYENKTGSES